MNIEKIEYRGYEILTWRDTEYERETNFGIFYTAIPREFDPDGRKISELLTDENKIDEQYVAIPVYCYIHGEIALSTTRGGQFSDKWDSRFAGLMAVTKKYAEEYGLQDVDQIKLTLQYDVEELDAVCRENVYGYTIIKDDEEILSCGGYVGDEDWCIRDAKYEIDYIIDR